MTELEEWVSVSEAAERHEVTKETIRNWAESGKIKSMGAGAAMTLSTIGMPARKQLEAGPASETPAPGAKAPTLEQIVNARPEVIEAEVKKRVELAAEAARFASGNIKSADDLEAKHKVIDDRLSEVAGIRSTLDAEKTAFSLEKIEWGKRTNALIKKLADDRALWEREKANERAGIESEKMALDKRQGELDAKEAGLNGLQENVASAWEEVRGIRAELGAEKVRKLEKEEEQRKLVNRLQAGAYSEYEARMNEILDILYKYGVRKLVHRADERLKVMSKWASNGLPEKIDDLVADMAELLDAVNSKAGDMAEKEKQYPPKSWNSVVDIVVEIIALFPEITPENWVSDDEANTPENIKKGVTTNVGTGKTTKATPV